MVLHMKVILLSLVMLLIGFEPAFSGKFLKKLNKELKKMKYQTFDQDFFADIGKNAVDIQTIADEVDSNTALIGNNTVEIGNNADEIDSNTALIGAIFTTATTTATTTTTTNVISSSLIFVIRGDGSQSVQVIDVDGTQTCSDLTPYPINPLGGGGGLLEDTPVLCGGFSAATECYSYDKASTTWQLLANLATGRFFFGAAIFKGALWVTGGHNVSVSFDSTEIIALDGTVTSGINLPYKRSSHSMVVINDDEFMILGGGYHHQWKTTMTYNANSKTFISGPSLIYVRRSASCSMFQSKLHNDRQVVLCAGGFFDPGTAELLDFSQENAQWTEVDDLPISFDIPQDSTQNPVIYTGARSMPTMTGDGVYLRAGEYLFLFTCDKSSCQWTTVKEGLEVARYGVMMPLPSDYTCE